MTNSKNTTYLLKGKLGKAITDAIAKVEKKAILQRTNEGRKTFKQ